METDANPLGRFCMPLHGAATTYQRPDTAVHDVSNTAYRLIATRSYRGYGHLINALRSWAGSMLSDNGPLSAVVCSGSSPSAKNKGCRATILFHNNFTLSLHRADCVPRPAPLQHHFTIHNGVATSYYAFQASFET